MQRDIGKYFINCLPPIEKKLHELFFVVVSPVSPVALRLVLNGRDYGRFVKIPADGRGFAQLIPFSGGLSGKKARKTLFAFLFCRRFPFNVDDDKLRFGSGFKFYCPVGKAGSDDEVCFVPFFQAVGFVVGADPFADLVEREKLAAVGMAGKDQVDFRRRLVLIVVRLMVEDDGEFVRIKVFGQFLHCQPAAAAFRFRPVLPADEAKAAGNRFTFVFKDFDVVFFQFVDQFSAAETAVSRSVIAFVVVAESEVNAVGRFKGSQCTGGGDHFFAAGSVVDEIAGDNDQIGILFLHGSDMFGKAFAVKGRSDVRIGKQDNPQVADCFFAFYRVGGNPYPVIQIPAGCKRGKAERCGGIAGIIAFKRPFAKTADEGENKIADKPEKNEMQQTDDRVHQVYQPGNDGKYQYDRGQPDQQPAFGSAAGGDEFGCAGAEVQQSAAGEKNQQNKYYIPHQHVVFSVLLSFF